MTDDQMIALLENLGLRPGIDWRLAKIDGRPEIVITMHAMRVLAEHAPDRQKADALLAALAERFPEASP